MEQSNTASNIYADNNRDNGEFDLLYDIQNISELLFAQHEDAPEILVFNRPDYAINNQQASNSNGNTNDTIGNTAFGSNQNLQANNLTTTGEP